MRSGFLVFLAVLALTLGACSRGGAPGSDSGSSTDSSLGDVVSEPGLFFSQAPKGWAVQEDPELDYATCVGPAESDGSSPSIKTNSQGYQSVDDYVKSITPDTGGAKIVDRGSFTTRSDVAGQRLVIQKDSQERVVYVFPGKSGLLLTFNCSCPAAEDGQFRPLFDASMKSLTLDKE
jgi:hypothetical protein